MSVDNAVKALENNEEVAEFYVLVREIKMYLKIAAGDYHPRIGIKIYKSNRPSPEVYSFEVSHNIHTPVQAAPYYPSRTNYETENLAIDYAIRTTTAFIKEAIDEGHKPQDSWLVANDDF